MRLRFLYLTVVFLGLINLSAYLKPHYAGLLTDDYGILTSNDFHEDGQLSTESNFPHDEFENYWQCLRPEEYFLNCENPGPLLSGENDIGQSTFWIRADGKVYNFGTRRNWDLEFCQDMISDIRKLIEGEHVVCIYASHLDSNEQQSNWVIDRVKTRKGEWSWFLSPGDPGYEESPK